MSQQPIPSLDAYAELREKLAKATPLGHKHETSGELLACIACKERYEARIELENAVVDALPGLLDELTKLRSEREALVAKWRELAAKADTSSEREDYIEYRDILRSCADELERLAGERT